MFRWCSFCQKFLGESAPRTDYSLTHGICRGCKARVREITRSTIDDIQPLVRFFQELGRSVALSKRVDSQEVLGRARSLGIQSVDLLAGVLQPLLYEIGEGYSRGEVSVAQEHLFSAFVDELIRALRAEYWPTNAPVPDRADVLLVCTEGNGHSFGVRFVELALLQEGISVFAGVKGIGTAEILALGTRLGSRIVGISVSLPNQLPSLSHLQAQLQKMGPAAAPLVLLGGQGIDERAPAISGTSVYKGDLQGLVALVVEHLKTTQPQVA